MPEVFHLEGFPSRSAIALRPYRGASAQRSAIAFLGSIQLKFNLDAYQWIPSLSTQWAKTRILNSLLAKSQNYPKQN